MGRVATRGQARAPSTADMRTKRVTTGSVVTAGQVDVTVTWDSPFADDNYTVVASVEIDEGGEDLRVRRIRTKTATQVVVNVVNNALVSRTGVVHAVAVHDD